MAYSNYQLMSTETIEYYDTIYEIPQSIFRISFMTGRF